MALIQIATAFNIDLEFEIAEFHKRLLAYIIDFILLIIYLSSMKYMLYDELLLNWDENAGLDILIISLPMLLYSLLTELWFNGQTIGKKIMSIRVISLEGGEPTFGQFLLRWITKFFEWPFLFGYIAFSSTNLIAYTFITGLFGIAAASFNRWQSSLPVMGLIPPSRGFALRGRACGLPRGALRDNRRRLPADWPSFPRPSRPASNSRPAPELRPSSRRSAPDGQRL